MLNWNTLTMPALERLLQFPGRGGALPGGEAGHNVTLGG